MDLCPSGGSQPSIKRRVRPKTDRIKTSKCWVLHSSGAQAHDSARNKRQSTKINLNKCCVCSLLCCPHVAIKSGKLQRLKAISISFRNMILNFTNSKVFLNLKFVKCKLKSQTLKIKNPRWEKQKVSYICQILVKEFNN